MCKEANLNVIILWLFIVLGKLVCVSQVKQLELVGTYTNVSSSALNFSNFYVTGTSKKYFVIIYLYN